MRQGLRVGLLALVLAGLGVVIVPRAWERVFPAPVQQDEDAAEMDLDRTIDEVQRQIAVDLRAMGVAPADIVATETERRQRGEQLWTFTRTTVDLADEPREADLDAAFGAWPAQVEAFVTRPDELTWSVRVYAGTFPVHQVLLRLPLDPAPVVDPETPPRLAVVVTGLGGRSEDAERWIASPWPLTLALHPYHSHTQRYATDAARGSKEVAVQLAFDERAAGGTETGAMGMAVPDPLSLEMEADALRSRLEQDLAAVPYASGALVLQGSPTTRDAAAMELLAATLAGSQLYLLDEGSGDGVAVEMARRQAVPSTSRVVRVPAAAGPEQAARVLLRAQNLAVRRGSALVCVPLAAVGSADLDAFLAARSEEGYRLVFASELLAETTLAAADGR